MSGMDSQSVNWMGVCGTKGGDFKWKSLGFSSFLTLKTWSPQRCAPVMTGAAFCVVFRGRACIPAQCASLCRSATSLLCSHTALLFAVPILGL